ncbi:NeuD/PglB/VioB family sugar acetyltransferase [Microlunatus capsulatus]|uniref:Sugar O-acyltransferase (Sialic acid O-acetyltransferase NeuD family) n=1 Tax=Microlunatus capsulatus TaxID=99117 RepID=A0ABS4ZBY7_9ACTN|nr:NeuD/PglB/VioB family sugar acetyltransferase [Microlunatus capsulatus]MBP2418571.1 sugar O-acyltransferase (sialic acid O-acetyltransferase NeuD family) [Microlunatus capsulatus]
MSDSVILVAAGGLAREVVAALETSTDLKVVGLVDDDPVRHGTTVGGHPVLGGTEALHDHSEALLVLCAGRGQGRRALAERLARDGVSADRWATVVDPSVRVPDSCRVGSGSVLLAGVVLTSDVVVGRHVVVMPQVTLTHDDEVEDYATLCAGVRLGGGVRVGSAAYLGMSSSVRQGVEVGAGATLGMGAVLLQDLPAGQTWAGVPARSLRDAAG